MKFQTNPQLQLAFDFLQSTNRNIFLTGKAGTGKTTFLHQLRIQSPKRMVVVAPTGVAAINAGGVTIHSFFQISFGPQIPWDPNTRRPVAVDDDKSVAAGIKRFSREKINIIRSLDLLVIDEISMVRADLLDAIDEVLRRFKDRSKPFGGVQLLMIGDLQQLAPVIKDDEWNILHNYYDTCYFFSSRALKQSNFLGIELTHIFRQNDEKFIDLLNRVRENKIDEETLCRLNERYRPNFDPRDDEGYITLTTHNYQAQQINEVKLGQLKTKKHSFDAIVEGSFPEFSFPTDLNLILKAGAQVMFVKNDSSPQKQYYNGKIGKIVTIDDDIVYVLCPNELEPIAVHPEEWQNVKYVLNDETQEIDEETIGTFTQYPLKLAWAITIHKSQGLTFERAIINARLSFAHGQVYVALSRCKTLEGLVLSEPIALSSVKNDNSVVRFISEVEQNQPNENELNMARKAYQIQLINDLFDFSLLLKLVSIFLSRWAGNSSSLQGNLSDLLKNQITMIQSGIVSVAEKFQKQIGQMMNSVADAESDQHIQDRIKKGSSYFLSKLQILEDAMHTGTYQTDNKAVRKEISATVDLLGKELFVKKSCLENSLTGFLVKKYLEVRAKSSIDTTENVRPKNVTAQLTDMKYPHFYQRLMDWRRLTSEELNLEIAKVLPQKTLLNIAQTLPASGAELKAIKGMGGTKMAMFGREILKMSVDCRRELGLELPMNTEKEVAMAGLPSDQISKAMAQDGQSISEIAEKRSLAESTILSHLLKYVADGSLDVFTLVDRAMYNEISSALDHHRKYAYRDLRDGFDGRFSIVDLRLVVAHLNLEVKGSSKES